MHDSKIKFLILVLLTVAAGYLAWPSENKPGFRKGAALENVKLNLGLDLQGGAWFRVRLKPGNLSEQALQKGTEEALQILSRRINLRGLKEPRISRVGTHEIQIEVPGLKTKQHVEDFREVILGAGHLEFKIESSATRLGSEAPPGTRIYTKADGGESVIVDEKAVLEGKAIADAKPGLGDHGGFEVSFEMTNEGATKLGNITEKNIGRRLAIILDDRLVSAPVIQSKIERSGRITGQFTEQQVADIVTVLKTGSLVAPLEIVGSSFVGPGLGQDSIDRGLKACYFSLLVVVVFMLVYYRHAGMVANIAMFMNIILILALLALFGATLTLPGIGGLVLTMGMAVDANILVFERMREEKEKGRNAAQCVEAGFAKAFSAIVDGNLTTLLTGIILYYFGTGPIQGFAVTLSIGILTTLFTALFCSRVMMDLLVGTGMVKSWSMMRLLTTPRIGFMKLARPAVAVSAVLCLVGVISWFARGQNKYGIDFRGGVAINIRFKEATPIQDVRDAVNMITVDGTANGAKKYPGAEVQAVILGADASDTNKSFEFKIRALTAGRAEGVDQEKLKDELEADLRKSFAGKIPEPAVQAGKKLDAGKFAGGGTVLISLNEAKPSTELIPILEGILDSLGVLAPPERTLPYVTAPDGKGGETEGPAATYEIYLMPQNYTNWPQILENVGAELKGKGYGLSGDPFPMIETVSASIVNELKEKAIIALILSWIGIILYLAVRFEFKWGVAAVVALVHNSLLAVTFTVILDALIPKSWGVDLALSLTTVAAILTVIGYSVNDTVVIFDRLRENFREAKSRGLGQVIDEALNQTLSRTLITGTTVIFNLIVLLVVTLTSGGGIAALALPLLIGVVVGTYASLFVATPILYWWRKKGGEAEAKA
jgi:SecD/SecF fusion protein